MCSCCSGERRSTSSSVIWWPVARSWVMASSRYWAFQSTSALSAKPNAELVFLAVAIGLAQLALVAVEDDPGDGVPALVAVEPDAGLAGGSA
jgi:hypothetical protein